MLVLFSLILTYIGIVHNYNSVELGSIPEFFLLLISLIVLAYNEGFQVGVLGMQHLTHQYVCDAGYPRAAKVHTLVYNSGYANQSKLKCLLIGQSFFVVLCSFTISNLTSYTDEPREVMLFGINVMKYSMVQWLTITGFSGVVVTITFAQLLPSILAKEYPMRFTNLPGVYSIIKCCLFIEESGLLYFVYMLANILSRALCLVKSNTNHQLVPTAPEIYTANPMQEALPVEESTSPEAHVALREHVIEIPHKEEMSTYTSIITLFITIIKYIISTLITLCCIAFTVYGILMGYNGLSFSILIQSVVCITALLIIFYCEGLKISIVSTSHLIRPVGRKSKASPHIFPGYIRAADIHHLLSPKIDTLPLIENEVEDRVKKFLLGRQMIVVPLAFIISNITQLNHFPTNKLDSFLYACIITFGLPGVLIFVQFAQLAPQLIADEYKIDFMNMRGSYCIIYLALCVESLGITNCTWVLYGIINYILVNTNLLN